VCRLRATDEAEEERSPLAQAVWDQRRNGGVVMRSEERGETERYIDVLECAGDLVDVVEATGEVTSIDITSARPWRDQIVEIAKAHEAEWVFDVSMQPKPMRLDAYLNRIGRTS
jgi:hypothetical protein